MSTFLALHDTRVGGGVPSVNGRWSGGRQTSPDLHVTILNAGIPLSNAFAVVNFYRQIEVIHTLFIVCHGYAGQNTRQGTCMDAGGMGLELGQDRVLHENVSMWTAIRNAAKNIVVYSCGAADTQPGNEGTTADGAYLMGALALHTNADVYAADRIQWYRSGAVNRFGAWEGQLYCFSAKRNGQSRPVRHAPVELDELTRSVH